MLKSDVKCKTTFNAVKTKTGFLLIFLLIISLVLALQSNLIYAQTETDKTAQELEQKIQEYQRKINELQQQKNTLSSQITYMDTQIALTTLQIKQTEVNVIKTEEEIKNLTGKIDNLNKSLDYLIGIMLKKIAKGYKTKEISLLDLVLNSKNMSVLVNRIKYLKISQDNDRHVAFQAQQAKMNYEEQKNLREEKKKQLDKLKKILDRQKIDLNNQKTAKQRLLEVTKNDEKTYQQLLEEAQKQLAGFKSFVKSAGGGVISANGFGAGEGGWYYSQRDERWAYKTIGYSKENILEVGCLLTSIAMVMKKNGVDWTPFDIAASPNYFFSNTAYMLKPSLFSWPNGLKYNNIAVSEINNEIVSGRTVIIGLYAGKYGTHYVVLKKVEGDDYIMHDPYYGPDKKFSDYYSKSSIFVAGVFK